MTNMKDFKSIADTALINLKVNDDLRRKTMKKLNSKRSSWHRMALVPASCAAVLTLVICAVVFYHGGKSIQPDSDNSGITTMMANDGVNTDKTPGNTFTSDVQVLESWNLKTMDEVKEYMDGAALIPSYLPENSKLKEILAAGKKVGDPISIFMEFELNSRPFTISQNKGVTQKIENGDSEQIDINGIKASIDSNEFGTTIRWYKNDFMYDIQGSLSKEEAIKVTKSLK